MIKRFLNPRFNQAVLDGIKTTTIRDSPWPIGVPIMFFNWRDKPYRSKHVDLCPIQVVQRCQISIQHRPDSGMRYRWELPLDRELFGTEGFESYKDMHNWFKNVVNPGETAFKYLHKFRRI